MALTDIKIKSLKPKDKAYKVFDGNGLYIYISPNGSKKWRIKYRFDGKENIFSLGEYPLILLREARGKLLELKEKIIRGEDPRFLNKKNASAMAGGTFYEVAEDWLKKQKTRWTESHIQTIIGRLNLYVYKSFGTFSITEITPVMVLAMLRKIEERGKIETAHRVLGICSQVFRYAVACGICFSDPCRDLRGALTYHKEKPRAALTKPQDVAYLMKLIHNYLPGGIVHYALLWSAYTFCRPGEIRRAEWNEIDFAKKLWVIPADKMKMKKEHKVPLCEQCMQILEKLKGIDEKWIFPSTRKGKCLSEAGVLAAIRSMGFTKEQMTAHGFRAMASTLLNEMGYRFDLIERSLAHGDEDKIRAAYNRAEYMEERRKMMQEWADYLDELTDK